MPDNQSTTESSSQSARGGDVRAHSKHKFRSDKTSLWAKPSIDGPGVWVTCVKGKERQTVGELYDLFEDLAAEIWPDDRQGDDDADEEEQINLEAQIAKELASLKRPNKERRFANCQTNTKCVIFISCKPPVDPVRLVTTHINNVLRTGATRMRYTHRFVPSSGTSQATIPDMHNLCRRIFPPFFSRDPSRKYSYKVELTVRNHTTLTRPTIIQEIARCVPEGHTVNLQNPEIFILVEVFKSVCGISIVEDYYKLRKFNVSEISNAGKVRQGQFWPGEGRLGKEQ